MTHALDDKNFRLPAAVRPQAYRFTLSLDWSNDRFTGEGRQRLTLAESLQELVLHGIELEVTDARWTTSTGTTVKLSAARAVGISETLALRFEQALPAGDGELWITWKGAFSGGLRGMYRAGEVVSTQFEAADARRVFPCFDEPSFKATWALTVRGVPAGMTALSNGRVLRDGAVDGTREVEFAETEVLSSYLIAFVAGPLVSTAEESVEGVPLRTWALSNKGHLTAFGQEVAKAVLPRLREYFGLPYAFGKVDQVGIPDFEAGAMENAGLITFREVALLVDPATASLNVKKRIAEVVTHELAHQWFGNWVTMVWWDDLWLNEAFATWMAYKIVDAWRPEWRVWLDFDVGKASALHLDALRSTHPVRGEVHNAAEAGESFDAITYEKGGAVLRMLEGFLGEESFRDGMRRYMRQHARANATADDLWSALAEASAQPVVELANAWLKQGGYPLVQLSFDGARVDLSQQRFFSAPGQQGDEVWPVPMVLRWEDLQGEVHETRVLLRERARTLTLPAPARWVCGNAAASGFYRVGYDAAAREALAQGLGKLAPAERVALLADLWAQVRAGLAEVGDFLTLAARFGSETDDAVLEELVGRLGFVESKLVEGAEVARLRSFVEQLLGGQLATVGWDAKEGEDDGTRLRRAQLIRGLAGVARSPAALAEGRTRLSRVLAGDEQALENNLRDPVAHAVAREGDAALFDTFRERFPKETDPATQRRYLQALAAFETPELHARARELFFSGGVPMQDSAGFVGGLMANRVARPIFWGELRTRFPEVKQRTGGAPMLMRRVVESLGNLDTREDLEAMNAFFAKEPLDEVKQAVAQTAERVAQQVELRERAIPAVQRWLATRG